MPTNSQIRETIAENVQGERDRMIMERRLIDKITFEGLAEEFGMSDRQIKRIVKRISMQIFR